MGYRWEMKGDFGSQRPQQDKPSGWDSRAEELLALEGLGLRLGLLLWVMRSPRAHVFKRCELKVRL